MSQLLQFFILLPFAALVASLFVPRKKERIMSTLAIGAVGLQLAAVTAFVVWWLVNGYPVLDIKQLVLYKSPEFEFAINFYFDAVTAVFAFVGALLTFLVTIFSRFYMHREDGFKRFFSTLLLFFSGYNLLVFAGNFETFFTGWEILGITSFLLIAFYRDRYLPVKNGFKVLSFYRLGDICLILAMWMSHHLWHRNITFAEWADAGLVAEQFQQHYGAAMFITAMILIAAAIKSAQLPFSTWLPRAMEGPTTSSAIFYGSLAVHIGAFLLLRTFPFWEGQTLVRGIIIGLGLITSIIATSIARVQSTVKTQIAYASVAQLGLIFIEIALGFHVLALIHFAGNAFLRTYQLLVSPSVLSYLVHDMFFNFVPRKADNSNGLLQRLKQGVYILGIKEWNFDYLLYRYLWSPFKWIGARLGFMNRRWGVAVWLLLLIAGSAAFSLKETTGHLATTIAPLFFAGVALAMVLKAFAERGEAQHAWIMALFSQFFAALSFLWNKHLPLEQAAMYLGGTVVAGISGYLCLRYLKAREGELVLDHYHGHSYEHRGLALVFLLSCLGFSGFPITPTFIGIDLMFTHIAADKAGLAVVTALNFLFLELTILRVYTRVFLGQHKKAYHPIAFKSS